jgi:hypothetical protein
MTLVNDAMSASMPGTAKQFLSTVQPKPIGQMVMYVAIIAILPLLGYLLGGMIANWGLQWGVVFGIIMYIGTIAAVIGAGMVVGLLSNGILGRQVSSEEAVTLVGYAATPAIAIGFISGLLAFNWGLGILGTILGFLGWLYMGYLIYLGGGVKYGTDKAMIAAVIALVAGFAITWIFSAIAMSILWQSIWGAYANQYANLARYYYP